jgi:hypothetical protein
MSRRYGALVWDGAARTAATSLARVETDSPAAGPRAERGALGASDCEAIRAGLLAQPVAAVSSLGYVALGGALLAAWSDLPEGERRTAQTYAGLLMLVGVGSVAYHGPQGPGAQLLHDLPIGLVLVMAVGVPVSRRARGRTELHTASRRRVRSLVGLTAGAGLAYLAGRTRAPSCRPDSMLQAHAVWHLASAGALAGWGTLLWETPALGSRS